MSEATTLKQLMLDAARYRWLRGRVCKHVDMFTRGERFRFPVIWLADDAQKGSVAQLLDEHIDRELDSE